MSLLNFTWAQTPTTQNPYIGTTVTELDPGQTYEQDKQTIQTLDQYGNLLTMKAYNLGNGSPGALARTYTNSYKGGTNYTSRYILNRLSTSTVFDGTNTATIISSTYDNGTISSVTGLSEHDANYPASFTYRGNVTNSTALTASTISLYDMTGTVTSTVVNGVTSGVTTGPTTNYAAPTLLTTNTLSSNITWNSFLGLTSATGPNLDSASITYDANARPSTTTSPYGAVTTYAYNDTASPPNTLATTCPTSAACNGPWVETVMDGFGRTIQTITGNGTGSGATTVSTVNTTYLPCGCSPLGKLSQQSQPFAPGGTPVYTVNHYDASGRTTSVVLPDTSTTTYSYAGGVVGVTSPSGTWKQFGMDAFGNIVNVAETDPSPLGTVWTYYTYDVLNHLTGVSMTRGSNTQTRTFSYNPSGGTTVSAYLQSATNPENGVVTYAYSNNLLTNKTDAKGQQFTYQHSDAYNRLTFDHLG